MTQSFDTFLTKVRSATSKEQENVLIADELADIRSVIRDCDQSLLPRLVLKLVFLNNLGFSVVFSQVEIIKLLGVDSFSYKRIGYLAAGAILTEGSAFLF
jgi:hypothetical protein